MIQVLFKDIPVNFKEIAQQIPKLNGFVEAREKTEDYIPVDEVRTMTIAYEGSANGFSLFSVAEADLWYAHTPHQQWIDAYIGFDPKYEQTVLVEKYSCMKIFDARIESFDKTLPVYTDRPKS